MSGSVTRPIFMDYHSTTPVDQRVLEAMLPYFTEIFGNAASRNHAFGWAAEEAVERARATVAGVLHADPKEIIFTSGATESNNLAIRGVAEMARGKGDHLITVATEHRCVLEPCARLERQGFRVTYLPVDREGLVDPDAVRRAITDRTILVSVMLANNEIGTIAPLAEIAAVAKARGVLVHTDAAQAVGKIPVDVEALGVDLLSLSAHKVYGPKGSGALYVRRKNPHVRLSPLIDGGGHERGLRSGTVNVPGVVGLAAACAVAQAEMPEEAGRLRRLRDRLRDHLVGALDETVLNGHPAQRLPGNLNMSFAYVEGEALIMGLNDVAVSSGSACTSASMEPSHVLRALGIGDDLVHSSIRFGLGRWTTEHEVDEVAARVVAHVKRLRALSPLYTRGEGRGAGGEVTDD